MNSPEMLRYSKSHEWVLLEGEVATVGLTDYAQNKLGDIVFVNLPLAGDAVVAGEPLGDVESVKAVSDVYSPVTGTVADVNEVLLDAPQVINEEAFEAWLIKVEGVTDTEELLSAAEYEAYTASLED